MDVRGSDVGTENPYNTGDGGGGYPNAGGDATNYTRCAWEGMPISCGQAFKIATLMNHPISRPAPAPRGTGGEMPASARPHGPSATEKEVDAPDKGNILSASSTPVVKREWVVDESCGCPKWVPPEVYDPSIHTLWTFSHNLKYTSTAGEVILDSAGPSSLLPGGYWLNGVAVGMEDNSRNIADGANPNEQLSAADQHAMASSPWTVSKVGRIQYTTPPRLPDAIQGELDLGPLAGQLTYSRYGKGYASLGVSGGGDLFDFNVTGLWFLPAAGRGLPSPTRVNNFILGEGTGVFAASRGVGVGATYSSGEIVPQVGVGTSGASGSSTYGFPFQRINGKLGQWRY